MTRTELEKHLGKKVEVTLFDGDVIKGVLHKSGEDLFINDLNIYLPKNYYFCTNGTGFCSCFCLFRVSHIKRFKVLGDE